MTNNNTDVNSALVNVFWYSIVLLYIPTECNSSGIVYQLKLSLSNEEKKSRRRRKQNKAEGEQNFLFSTLFKVR